MTLSEYPDKLRHQFSMFEIANYKVLKANLIITMIRDNGTIEYHKVEYKAKNNEHSNPIPLRQ